MLVGATAVCAQLCRRVWHAYARGKERGQRTPSTLIWSRGQDNRSIRLITQNCLQPLQRKLLSTVAAAVAVATALPQQHIHTYAQRSAEAASSGSVTYQVQDLLSNTPGKWERAASRQRWREGCQLAAAAAAAPQKTRKNTGKREKASYTALSLLPLPLSFSLSRSALRCIKTKAQAKQKIKINEGGARRREKCCQASQGRRANGGGGRQGHCGGVWTHTLGVKARECAGSECVCLCLCECVANKCGNFIYICPASFEFRRLHCQRVRYQQSGPLNWGNIFLFVMATLNRSRLGSPFTLRAFSSHLNEV